MLKPNYQDNGLTEAGCDEAGRGCLAGPVFASVVILPPGYTNPLLNDSKKLSARQRDLLRIQIEKDALQWQVAQVSPQIIDKINILNASILAMHLAIDPLFPKPDLLLIDGNRFKPYNGIDHKCIVKGDGIYMSIAAASILAKTHRDEFMKNLHQDFRAYGWDRNMGYPTKMHRNAIQKYGITPWHRITFRISEQLSLEL
ncbi:MAG: ribonuclease HII [Lentimicrobium sp.]|nr:ribonuclease HII [Lentimicrobium sp.]